MHIVRVQVDQQWLEEVGEVCEGEDIDRMMAQAIAMEDNRQVTSRDHLFGIEDRVIREGQYASRLRGMYNNTCALSPGSPLCVVAT